MDARVVEDHEPADHTQVQRESDNVHGRHVGRGEEQQKVEKVLEWMGEQVVVHLGALIVMVVLPIVAEGRITHHRQASGRDQEQDSGYFRITLAEAMSELLTLWTCL